MKNVKLIFLTLTLMLFFTDISAQLEWVKFNGELPGNAVIGGVEDHRSLGICRCNYKGSMHSGKVVEKMCNIGYGGIEQTLTSFEVLVNNGNVELDWLKSDGSSLPDHTIQTGSEYGKPLYVGRAYYENGTHPGKVFKVGEKYICNIGFGGKEVTLTTFEFLIENHHPDKLNPDKRCIDENSPFVVVSNITTLSKENQLNEGFSLASRNLEYQTRVTDDGRLVVEEILDHIICDEGKILVLNSKEIWSNTSEKRDAAKDYFLKYQNDGNLCIYSEQDGFVWCSMSHNLNGDHFEITNRGHIEIVNSHGVEVWPD